MWSASCHDSETLLFSHPNVLHAINATDQFSKTLFFLVFMSRIPNDEVQKPSSSESYIAVCGHIHISQFNM
jgi:hypothetical protein